MPDPYPTLPTRDEPPTSGPADHAGEMPTVPPQPLQTRSDIADLKPGDEIGPFTIIETIGEGGFGLVCLAEQRYPVRRRVALKLVKAGMDTREVLARFETERQALAVMDHPNVARVFDAGMTDRGRPWFAMEYVPGVPITEYCDRHRMSTAERLRLFIPICRAVQHAHQKGIIHRDLKPSNILVMMVDGEPVPKVIDFGIAKAQDLRLDQRSLHTEAGRIIGTPEYMSPEQAGTTGLDIDSRTDVYSLGVVLYELLTGVLPFESATLRAAGIETIQRMIRDVDPPRPSTRIGTAATVAVSNAAPNHPATIDIARLRRTELGSLKRQIRGDLDWIIMKCLEKDRSRRYDSPGNLAMDIERHLNNEPVLASPPSSLYRVRKTLRRHRAAAAVGALITLVILGSLVAVSMLYVRAEEQRELATTEAAKANAGLAFLEDMFNSIDPARARGREISVKEVLDDAAAKADQLGNPAAAQQTPPEVEAFVRHVLAVAYQRLGRYDESRRQLERSLELRRTALGDRAEPTLEALSNLGAVHISLGNVDEAEKALTEALAGRTAVLGPTHVDTLATKSHLSLVLQDQEKHDEALELMREIATDQARTLGPDDRYTLETRTSIADILHNALGDFPSAETEARAVIDLAQKRYGPDDPLVLQGKSILGSILRDTGKVAESVALLEEIVAAKKRVYGEDHSETLTTQNALAMGLRPLGRNEEAEQLTRHVYEKALQLYGPEHPTTMIYQNNYAQLLHQMKRLDEAGAMYEDVLAKRKRISGEQALDTLIAYNNLGLMYADLGEYERALPYLETTLKGLEATLPANHWMIGASSCFVAESLGGVGRSEEALAKFTAGYDILTQTLGPDHTRTKTAAENAMKLCETLNRPEEAALWKQRAGQ